jgi:hypothetical protein
VAVYYDVLGADDLNGFANVTAGAGTGQSDDRPATDGTVHITEE